MKKILLAYLLVTPTILQAQLSAEQRIPDSVIGWWDNTRYDHYIQPTTDPVQKRRIQITDSLVSWMKKSYTPVGGLGTWTRQNQKSWFGTQFLVWNVSHDKMWTDEKGHFKPIPEENTAFAIQANTLPAVAVLDFLNFGTDYYFTWPPDGYMSEVEKNRRKGYVFKTHPNVSSFITRITARQNCIILSPGNIPPYVEVTIGEFLDKAEASIDKEKQKEKERINSQWPGNDERNSKTRAEVWAGKEEQFNKTLARIHIWREKYRHQLNEPAIYNGYNQTLLGAFDDDNNDPFAVREMDRASLNYHIVYKVPAATVEKCKSEFPQWITAWYPFESKEDGNQLYEMSTAMTENVNYAYLYNYFFDPAKVKGKAYTASNADQLKARLDAYRKKNQDNAASTPVTGKWGPNVHFFDDFAASPAGGDPAGWQFSRFGEHAVVTTPANENGKWLLLGANNTVTPVLIKRPFPANFLLEYDQVTDAFPGRFGGSARLYLSSNIPTANGGETGAPNSAIISLDINAGNEDDYTNNNYRGEAIFKLKKTPEVNTENGVSGAQYNYPLKEFTNKKTKVHVGLQVKNGQFTVFINEKPVITAKDMLLSYGSPCADCSIPASLRFNILKWTCTTDRPAETKVYISNVKITQL